MALSKKMASAINDQIQNEFFSYWLYLSMAYSFETMDLKMFAKWYHEQANEEQVHALKMADYLNDQGAAVKLQSLDQPKSDFKTPLEIVSAGLEHEKFITGKINEMVNLAREEKDFATENFFQWFVHEQVEEEATASEMVALVRMSDSTGQLLMLENRIASLRSNGSE